MMLTAWHASSQTVTQKDSVVISKEVARKALIELTDYDRLRENKVEANLEKCIEIQKEKDTLIGYMSQQNKLFEETLRLTEKQLEVKDQQLKTAKSKNGRSFIYGLVGFAAGVILGGVLLH